VINKRISNSLIIITFLLLLMLVIVATIVCPKNAYADVDISNEFDKIFYQTVDNLICEKNINTEVEAEKDIIYDIYLDPLGYIYDIRIDGVIGYVIIININGNVKVTECVLDACNPYLNQLGENVYINELTYASFYKDKYDIIGTSARLTYQELIKVHPDFYCGAVGLQTKNYEIRYISKSEDTHALAHSIPTYTVAETHNSCMPLAGANIIAYFDRYQVDLLPNYTPGNSLGSLYKYKKQNSTIDELVKQLYVDMKTNTTGEGTSIEQFKQGMYAYCQRANYNVNMEGCMLNGNIDFRKTKERLIDNQPIILFVSRMEISDIGEFDNRDSYEALYGNANHAMVGFGYREITYRLENNTTQNSEFILVSTGLNNLPKAYLNINNNLNLDMAYAINIY